MQEFEDYPFWDLIAEMAYKPGNETLRKGTYGRFQSLEAGKKLYLFGCNEACRLFIERFAAMYPIGGILDNSEARWGKEFCGLAVRNPREALPEILEADAAVIIALRLNADAAAEQLEEMGVRRYYGLGVLLSGISPYREMTKRLEALERQNWPYTSGRAAFSALLSRRLLMISFQRRMKFLVLSSSSPFSSMSAFSSARMASAAVSISFCWASISWSLLNRFSIIRSVMVLSPFRFGVGPGE